MGSDEMLEGNLALTSKDNYNVITNDEKERIQKIADKFKELSDNICTGCGYCMPCSNEVSIKNIFNYMVRYQIYGREDDAKLFYSQIGKVRWSPGKDATACIECEECLEKCPQNIPIIDQLKEAHILLG
ncbi:MAG: 4Fe-4S dicluster domain-containing protein [Candidatus Hodarchaeales archaeon]|jgi:predicted aldo/keto reductase-like oxidoreductase